MTNNVVLLPGVAGVVEFIVASGVFTCGNSVWSIAVIDATVLIGSYILGVSAIFQDSSAVCGLLVCCGCAWSLVMLGAAVCLAVLFQAWV